MPQPGSTLTPIRLKASIEQARQADPATTMRFSCRAGRPCLKVVEQPKPDRRYARGERDALGFSFCWTLAPSRCRPGMIRAAPTIAAEYGRPQARHGTSTTPAIPGRPPETRTSGRLSHRRAASSRDCCRARLSGAPWCRRCSRARSPCSHRTGPDNPRPPRHQLLIGVEVDAGRERNLRHLRFVAQQHHGAD